MPQTYYKIVDIDLKGNIKTLFHGIEGSRILPLNQWLIAEKKMVCDGSPGSTSYLSGFHVLETLHECLSSLEKLTNFEPKAIVECECKGLRPKEHSRDRGFLADEMIIKKVCDV
jgi:hypothetical protein